MINLKQIQQRFIETIQQSDIKQTELAEKLNLTQSTIAHYIKGDILPALDTLANLCKILDVDANYILCLE
ncbi:MAG: helix-turn-helix transcriptional regulator [Clostridia bacterium]|jgi:transcriptional regulator with XRE-family HTH domain|nr:helix-turn-helix transcriptional regulator [Clostridia bacterium]